MRRCEDCAFYEVDTNIYGKCVLMNAIVHYTKPSCARYEQVTKV